LLAEKIPKNTYDRVTTSRKNKEFQDLSEEVRKVIKYEVRKKYKTYRCVTKFTLRSSYLCDDDRTSFSQSFGTYLLGKQGITSLDDFRFPFFLTEIKNLITVESGKVELDIFPRK